MGYNKNMYCITHEDQEAERLANGFSDETSDQKQRRKLPFIIGDKGDQSMHEWCTYRDDVLPQWIKSIIGDSCCMTSDAARLIVRDSRWSTQVEFN